MEKNKNFEVFSKENLGSVRVCYGTKNATAWFVAKDVCDCLGIKNSRQALTRLMDDEKDVILNDTLGGKQRMSVISESGLYTLIMSARKEEAVEFQRWVTREVLPSIRRNGSYVMGQEDMTPAQRIKLLDLVEQASKRAKYFEEDSNHWYEQFTRLSQEYAEVTEELVKAGKYLRKGNGGIEPAEPKYKEGFLLREETTEEEKQGIWTNKEMFVVNIPDGLKYSIVETEER